MRRTEKMTVASTKNSVNTASAIRIVVVIVYSVHMASSRIVVLTIPLVAKTI